MKKILVLGIGLLMIGSTMAYVQAADFGTNVNSREMVTTNQGVGEGPCEGHKSGGKMMKEFDFATYEEFVVEVESHGDNGRGQMVLEVITNDNFDQFVAAHELKKTGDFEGAREIFESLGLERPEKKGHSGQKDGSRNQ